jgi:acyl transferase domain-containing protein/acyl carrier protein/NAD(P)-dependent dehydrogenase (short-subunit alcohol dehydrogenase family)
MTRAYDTTNVPLAIIGMACRLPGADNLDAYWRLLIEGRSAIGELPSDRLDQELYYDPRKGVRGKTYSKLGGFLTNKTFDRQTCPIPEELARSVDIAHLLMCDVTASAFRHAGLDPFNLPLRNTGVFIGHAQGSNLAGDYTYGTCIGEAAQFLREVKGFQQLPPAEQEAVIDELIATIRQPLPRQTANSPDVSASMIAGTVSRAFGLTGPYLALNSACASSLQAMLLAARALQLGRVEMAVAGGASDCKSDTLVLFAAAQSMSATASRPFDAEADGLICAEGYAAVVMKTLERALVDGDRILAVVRGLGISSDGRGKSLWAPRKEGQIKAMERAYETGVEMADLQYIEAHATATQLGDATELNTLAEVLAGKLPPGRKIPVTSVKANIGHSLEAAGVAGVIKAILAMHHGMVPPAINIRQLNTKIDWANSPVYVPQQPTPWPAPPEGKPRRAGVNAFGIGGLNMHVVIDQYTESARQLVGQRPQPTSASQSRTSGADAVAIIGRACIFPGAKNLAGFWELLASGRDPKTHVTPDRWNADLGCRPGKVEPYHSPTTLGGFITDFQYDWRTHKVPPKQVAQADPLQFMLLEAADQALQDAGYDKRPFDRTRVGVVVGTEFGGDFALQLQMGLRLPHMGRILKTLLTNRGLSAEQAGKIEQAFGDTLLDHWPALIDESGSFSTSSLASRITKSWDLMGGAAALDGGSTSALASLATSVDMLLAGDIDMMVCAAGQRRMALVAYESLAVANVLSPDDHPHAPFDTQANGYVPGEGVGVVLLKRLSDAVRDGDQIRGIIRGIAGARHESWGEAVRLAVERSLADAEVQTGDLALIDADGSGVPPLDEEQAQALIAVHGDQSRAEPLRLGTLVGQIGHTGGASGMATLLKATLEIEHDEMAPTVGLQAPVAAIAQHSTLIQAATSRTPLRHATQDGRRLGGVSGCAKGLAYHVVLEKGSKVPVPERKDQKTPAATPQPASPAEPLVAGTEPSRTPAALAEPADWRIFRLGAATPKELLQRLSEAATNGSSLFAGASATRFAPTDRVRLAIVAENPAALAQKLLTATKQVASPGARTVLEQQGIFFRQLGPRPPRIAFVFSGQGSQYSGMLRELIDSVPAAAAAMREADAVMTKLGYLTFAQMAWDETAPIGTDIWLTQASVLLADRIMLAALADRGIRPNVVFGHSYGEYVALMAAGVWDFEQTVRVTRARCDAIELTPSTRGAMLATTATPEMINQLAKRFGRPLFIANHNAPDQTVVAGQREIIEDFAMVVVRESFQARLLAVPCPFHTPIMKDAAIALEQSLADFPTGQPSVPVLSVVTNDYVHTPEEIRANLVAHMTQPVRYVELIRRVVAEDATVLVEVGPNQGLTGLHRRIVEGYNIPIIATDNPKRPGRMQLECVQALLECTGAFEAEEPAATVTSISRPTVQTPVARPEILHFDATTRRREKMRAAASGKPAATTRPTAAPVAQREPAPGRFRQAAPAASVTGNGPPKRSPQPAAGSAPTSLLNRMEQPSAPAPEAGRHGPARTSSGEASVSPPAAKPAAKFDLDPTELESFLIRFVVEQTGYPPEVVELDADLEADLGIDSIKKAQLFGELQEYFDVTPTEDLTLDDFPTLRHVVNFLRGIPIKGEASETPSTSDSQPAGEAVQVSEPNVTATGEETGRHVPAQTTTKAGPPAATAQDAKELEAFLINFVVEQTGYPPEVVELDADLEADLGIDSIKKAQLFGELQEYFDVTPTEDLTLDDFPTLRHVVNFLLGAPIKGETSAASESQPVDEATPVSEPNVPTRVEEAGRHGPARATSREGAPAVSSQNTAELEAFLVNFVVEQTGYPPEVVELDADLEADLGIDSIKKAQLFGELQEYFDVTPTEDLTLDDFPTLRHVVNFLLGAPIKGEASLERSSASERQPAGEPAPVSEPNVSTQGEETGRHALAQIDGTGQHVPARATSKEGAPAISAQNAAELEAFLVNFVVEQTGYPPEVVELDADLEADLGIDSIKKAQLFGELQEYFDVTPTEDLTLDDFPTLRHVVSFLLGNPIKGEATEQAPAPADEPARGYPFPAAERPAASGRLAAPEHVTSAVALETQEPARTAAFKVLRLGGTPYEMGQEHGRQEKRWIRQVLRRYADLSGSALDELPLRAGALQNPSALFAEEELAELQGIADAVEVPLGNILAHNLAMFAELGSGTMHFATSAATNAAGTLLHGLNEELPLSAALRECLAPVVQLRQPHGGIPYATLSAIGTIGAFGGINAAGLAMTINVNWDRQERDAAPRHATIVNAVLGRAVDVDTAVNVLQEFHGQESWNVCLSHYPSDRVAYVQADGQSFQVRPGDASVLSAPRSDASQGARKRVDRLAGLLASGTRSGLTAANLRTVLRGEASGEERRRIPSATAPIPCDALGLVFDAKAGELWINPGYLAADASRDYSCLKLNELLPVGKWATAQAAPRPATPLAPVVSQATGTDAILTPKHDLDDGAQQQEFTHRFVLTMVESPLNPAAPSVPQWHGRALVLGQNAAAAALRRRLGEQGVTLCELTVSEDLNATLRALDELWKQGPIPHLFLLSARDEGQPDLGDEAAWQQRRYRNVILPYFLCQRWLELAGAARMTNQCTLVAGLALGGDFGFASPVAIPECGSLTGLIKSLCIEFTVMRRYKDLLVKTIDAPSDEPAEHLADNILREVAAATMDYEVAFVGGKRYLQTALPQPAPVQAFAEIRPGAVWVVSGGARGITAACALELGRRFGLRLHLLGTSPLPQIDPSWRNLTEDGLKALKGSIVLQARQSRESPTEAWARVEKAIEIDRILKAYANEGIQVTYHRCDVSNRQALAQVLEKIRQTDGPIEGVLHGAGVDHACRYEKKRCDQVDAVFGAKVDGAYHLMTLTRQDPVRHFIGFGSVSGRMGGNGQTDYGAASDMLCKLIGWYRSQRPECYAVGFHYHPWDEVGMAVKPDTRAVLEMTDAPAFMPKREGLRHLLRELYAGTPESEVLITDWDYYQRFYGVAFLGNVEVESGELPPEGRVAQRYLLRTFEAPLPEPEPEKLSIDGPVLILGQNAAAQALCQRLVDQGVSVHLLPVSEHTSDVIAALERLWASQPAPTLFLMTARDDEGSQLFGREAWDNRKWSVSLPYLVTQRWFQLLLALPNPRRGTLVAATSLGGDFGFQEKVFAPEGGLLTGLLKSLYVEDTRRPESRIRVKAIDAPANEDPHALAESICRELAASQPEVEVAWSQGRRRVIRSVSQPIEPFRRLDLARGGNWVITGGARGITAAVALELGRRYGLRLHLIGRTAAPQEDAPWRNYTEEQMKQFKASIVRQAVAAGRSPEEEWENIKHDIEIYNTLKRMTEAGLKVTYHSCDVADWDALAKVLDRVREMDGPIQGIIHGAGYAKSFRFETIRTDRFFRTTRPKADGTVALMALTRRDPLHYFIAFGSISGRFGGNGLSDYAAANDLLAKLIGWYRHQRPEVASTCFHWQTWDRIGMAMLSDSVGITKNHLKMDFIPPEEGIEHLHQELRAALPEPEVLITDGYFERVFYPHEPNVPVDEANVPTKTHDRPLEREERRSQRETPRKSEATATPAAGTGRPLIAAVQSQESGLVAEILFDPTCDPFLLEHRLKDKPFLPGVVMLESLAEAASLWEPRRQVVALSNVEIVNGLLFHTDRPVTTRVTVTPTADGLSCALTSELRDRKDRVIQADRPLARGLVHLADAPLSLTAPPPGQPAIGWFEQQYPEAGPMYHGQPLRVLKQYSCQYDGAFGQIAAPSPRGLAGPRSPEGWLLPLAVLDACVYSCGNFIFLQFAGALEVPHGFDHLQLARLPREGENCTLRLYFRGRQRRHSRFDFTLFGADGSVILAAKGYRTILVGEGGV